MGRRKERRLAAMSAAGRRVKLDLFAEPSGDLGGSSVQDEVGGDLDSKSQAASPNSPSSSGQKVDNPLLLLGQYSDDELEEGLTKRVISAVVGISSANHDVEVKGLMVCEDVGTNAGEYIASEGVEQQDMERDGTSLDTHNLESIDIRENDVTALSSSKETNSVEQIFVPGNLDVQGTRDMSLGWKMVMHEESNQYYYWNTETGETSWEVPDVLVQVSQLSPEEKTFCITEGMEGARLGYEVKSTLDVECSDLSALHSTCVSMGANLVSETKEVCEYVSQINEYTGGYKVETSEAKDGAAIINQNELSSFAAVNDLLGNGSSIRTGLEKCMHEMMANKELETEIDISSSLMEQSERLLGKLMTLRGSMGDLADHGLILKYIWELEIRISDFKSLLSCGSSLLPFWEHSARQIKRLEDAVDDQINQFSKDAENEVNRHMKRDESLEGIGDACQADSNENKEPQNVVANGNIATTEHISSSGDPTNFGGNVAEANGGRVTGNDLLDKLTAKPALHAEEDVDMEVDDAIPSGNAAAQNPLDTENFPPLEQSIQSNNLPVGYSSLSEQSIQPNNLPVGYSSLPEQSIQPNNLPVEYSSLVSEHGFTIPPPPPDEEWIPPPPPDNEITPPPPPPDEPPEPAYPPPLSYPETAEPVPYAGQYNLSYPDSNFDYSGQNAAEVPSSSFYGLAEGHQVAMPHQPVYYDTVPSVYPGTALVLVNPVETGAYYGVQDGMVPPVSGVNNVESSGLHSGSAPVHSDTLASDQTSTLDSPAEMVGRSLSNRKVDVPDVSCHAEMASTEVAFSSASIQAPATSLVKESVPMPSTNVVAGSTASSISKVQSKASRTEKRTIAMTSSLRSNKKVSSLVDKWRAAKEELHEDEESEPENAIEILEKKRQREIEEWRAQQIASGEAKDNANFQPLGGDWREKVRRKRARKFSEDKQSSPERNTVYKGRQPDLAELSRDLPSGWQAYWDESTKQVYYGNAMTSETTWTRPAN